MCVCTCVCISVAVVAPCAEVLPHSCFEQTQDLETLKKFIQKRKPDRIVVGARGRCVCMSGTNSINNCMSPSVLSLLLFVCVLFCYVSEIPSMLWMS